MWPIGRPGSDGRERQAELEDGAAVGRASAAAADGNGDDSSKDEMEAHERCERSKGAGSEAQSDDMWRRRDAGYPVPNVPPGALQTLARPDEIARPTSRVRANTAV